MLDDDRLRAKIIKSINFKLDRSSESYALENIGWIWASTTPPRSFPDQAISGCVWSSEKYVIVFTTARDLGDWAPDPTTILTHWENPEWREYITPALVAQETDPDAPRKPERRGGRRTPIGGKRDSRSFSQKLALVRTALRAGVRGRIAISTQVGISVSTYYQIMKLID